MSSSNEQTDQNSSQDTIITNSSSLKKISKDPFTDHVFEYDNENNENVERSDIDNSSTIEESNQNRFHLNDVVEFVKAILGESVSNQDQEQQMRPLSTRSTGELNRIAQERISKTEEEFLFVVSGKEY